MLYLLGASLGSIFLSFAAYIFVVGAQLKEVNPSRIEFSWTKIILAITVSFLIWGPGLTLFAALSLLCKIDNQPKPIKRSVLYNTKEKWFCTSQEAIDSVNLDVVLVEKFVCTNSYIGFKSEGICAYTK